MTSKLYPLVLTTCFAGFAYAGDDPVNCRDEVTSFQDIYAGTPSCEASYVQSTCIPINSNLVETRKETIFVTLFGDYTESTKQSVRLSEFVTYPENSVAGPGACTIPRDVSEFITCSAELDFLESRPVKEKVCDFTPDANPKYYEITSYNTIVSARASDRDGEIVKYEWWVNGIKNESVTDSVELIRFRPSGTEPTAVTVKVTDNDGYTDTQTITARFKDPLTCDGQRC